jgi:hypothetical protein
MCQAHLLQWQNRGEMRPIRIPIGNGACSAPTEEGGGVCPRKPGHNSSEGPLCDSHYRYWRKHGTLKPLHQQIRGVQDHTCEAPGMTDTYCGREAKSLTPIPVCGTHYDQVRRGVELYAVKRSYPSRGRDENGNKRCCMCEQWLPEDSFPPNSNARDGLRSQCKPCVADERRARIYGITGQAYRALLDLQNGVCYLCREIPEGRQGFMVDHDHSCCPDSQKT